MNPFQILAVRGHIMENHATDPDSMVKGVVVDDNDAVSASRRPTRTQGRKLSIRDLRRPADLARSRHVGLVREVCAFCLAVRGPEHKTTHGRTCPVALSATLPDNERWNRQATGPIASHETSWDTGWR